MSHTSIAVLAYTPEEKDEKGNEEIHYLVHRLGKNKLKFFESQKHDGGGYEFSRFKKSILDHFELYSIKDSLEQNSEKNKKSPIDFIKIRLFKERKAPSVTVWKFELSSEQKGRIERCMEIGKSDRWKNILWINRSDLQKRQEDWIDSQKFVFEERGIFKHSDFPDELRTSLKNIAKARDNDKLVIFAGAGVSFDSGVPIWKELVNGLSTDIGGVKGSNLDLAQEYYEKRGNKEYQERVQELLNHENTRANAIHKKVVDISPNHILTSNYDSHFEEAIRQKGARFSIVKKDSDLPYTKFSSFLIKMHGDFDERNIVLKKTDYLDYKKNFPLLEGFVQGVFASKLVVFIGFSFDDPNLQEIYKSVKEILKKDAQPPYLVLSKVNPKDREKIENEFKLKVIDIGSESIIESIENYFNKESDSREDSDYQKLSTKGIKLFKFLEVIRKFDVLSDSFKGLDSEKLLVRSLMRFEDFGAIPQIMFRTILPFGEKGSESDGRAIIKANLNENKYQTIATPNEGLLRFLKELKGESEGIAFQSNWDRHEIKAKKDLDKCFKMLVMSGIRSVYRKSDLLAEEFNFLPQEGVECDCQSCLNDEMNFQSMLVSLPKNFIKSKGDEIDINDAYGFFITGQVLSSYYALEELRKVSWDRKKFVNFFITSLIQKMLHPYIHKGNCQDSTEKELDTVVRRIEKIDLDKILHELKLDKDVITALKILKDDDVYRNAEREINLRLATIKDLYENFKNKRRYYSGPNHWYIIEQEFWIVWNFKHKNRLLDIYDKPFLELAEKYLEAMVASFQTSEEYGQKMPKISGFFIQTAIIHSKSKFLDELFRKYKLEKIDLFEPERTVSENLKKFKNLIKSGFEEFSSFGSHIYVNQKFTYLIKESDLFKNRIERIFNNYLILFSRLELRHHEYSEVLDLSIKFAKSIPILRYHTSLKYFNLFVVAQIKQFDAETIGKYLEFLVEWKYMHDKGIPLVCDAICNKTQLRKFLGEKFYKSLEQTYLHKDELELSLFKSILGFYPLMDLESQKLFKDKITKRLLTEDDNSIISSAYNWGIWTPSSDSHIFDKFCSSIRLNIHLFKDYKMNDQGFPDELENYSIWNDIINLSIMVYSFNLFEDERVRKICKESQSNMVQWILAPHSFNYDKFEITWLFTFPEKSFINEFKKIDLIKKKLTSHLTEKYNEKLAQIFFLLS